MNIFKPEVFQGNLSSKNYFEGWYFKHVSENMDHVYSFIPGISLHPENRHAFIQVINGLTGKTQYIEYPLSSFSFNKNSFEVQVGDSVFTADSMLLNINSPLIKVSGRLCYSGSVKYPASTFSPGIMGWYSFVPFMECKHGVVSVTHQIDGSLQVDGELLDFSGGKGYIEKDWGKSFPESWIWLQSNNFVNTDACIMMSIAKIPWLGSFFTGFLGFLYYNGTFYPFSTYHKSEITALKLADEKLTLAFKGKKHRLVIKATLKNSGILLAPKSGKMSRRIKESIDSELEIVLSDLNGTELYRDIALRAGLEVIDGIFEIVKIKEPGNKLGI
ncbi:MAG: tocopherol cyclase family protein [Bacteroidota bacterium]